MMDTKTQELQDLFNRELHGIQRILAFLVNSPEATLEIIGLEPYEILPCESLHGVGHHFENFLTAFSKQLTAKERQLVEQTVELSIWGKDSRRFIDYRVA